MCDKKINNLLLVALEHSFKDQKGL